MYYIKVSVINLSKKEIYLTILKIASDNIIICDIGRYSYNLIHAYKISTRNIISNLPN